MAVSKGFELASLASNLDTSQVDGEVITINMDTDVVGEGSTNLYFTNERVDDRVSSLLVEGSNISLTYNDTAGTLTVALDITGGLDLSNNSTADLSEDPAATTTSGTMYYTDTRVQTYLSGGTASSIETTGNIIVGGNLTVNGSTTTINSTELAVDDLNITIASGAADSAAANGAGITVDGASATITYATSGDKWVFNKVPYYNTLRLLTTTDLTGSDNYAFKTITDGSNAAVANSNTGTFTITATDQIEATVGVATDTLTIGHATSGVTAAQYGSSIAIPVITIDAEGHITAATTSTVSTSWTLSDSVTTQSISAGDTLTVIDGTDINVVVGATDTLTVNNTSTLQTVTGRGNATTNSIGIGTSSVTSGYSLDIFGKTLAQDAVYIQDTVFTTAYDSITGLVVDSSHIDGTSAGYGNSITFTKRASTAHKKAAISLYQPNTDPDVSNLRFFVSPSATATDPVTLSLELMSGGQVKISDAYTLPLTDGAVNQALITNGSGAISFTTLDSVLNWNVANNYAFKTVVAGGTSLVADSNTDTLTISAAQLDSIDGIVIVGTVGTDTLTIAHANTSSVADLSGTANTFISAQTYDTYGHVLSRTASAVDFNVSGNYAYKFMSDGSNISSAASNTDTFTFINGTDTTAVVDSANDTVKFNNTSTLDSVTGRGNTTTNSITVNNAIVNGNLTVNGTTTIIDTTNLLIEDAIIVLNKNSVSAPANDIGFLLQRYSTASASNYNVAIAWNETDDRLVFGETIEDGTDNALSVSSEWMTITNTGRVGINDSSPDAQLHISYASSGSMLILERTDAASQLNISLASQKATFTSSVDGFRFIQGANTNYETRFGTHTFNNNSASPTLVLANDNTSVFYGNVGVGIVLPKTAINASSLTGAILTLENSDTAISTNDVIGGIDFYANDISAFGTGVNASIKAIATSAAGTLTALTFSTSDGTATPAVERFRIAANGNVGIGTLAPAAKLHLDTSNIGMPKIRFTHTNVNGDNFEIGSGVDGVSNGGWSIKDVDESTNRFSINSSGAITFNSAFTFPTTDGTLNQVMVTDGSGAISWGTATDSIVWNTSGNYAFTNITDGSNIAVADNNADTFTITATDQIEATIDVATDTLTLGHANSGVSAGQVGSGTAIPVITVDAQGHITALTTSAITTSWTISDSTTTQDIANGNTLIVADGTDINAVVTATDTLTINNTSTLDTVTGRGNTTTNDITVGAIFTGDSTGANSISDGGVSIGAGNDFNLYHYLGTNYIRATGQIIMNAPDNFRIRNGASDWVKVDGSNGNVGIGTSSPYADLHVTGTIKVATGNAQGILALGEGNGSTVNVGVWRGAANAPTTDGNYLNLGGYEGMVFATGAAAIGSQTETMRIDSSGNVGIGTDAPAAKLEVGKNEAVSHQVRITSGVWNESTLFFNSYSNYNYTLGNFGTSGSKKFQLKTNNGSVVLSTGGNDSTNVGIGTQTPLGNLQVHSTSQTEFRISTANGYTTKIKDEYSSTDTAAGTFPIQFAFTAAESISLVGKITIVSSNSTVGVASTQFAEVPFAIYQDTSNAVGISLGAQQTFGGGTQQVTSFTSSTSTNRADVVVNYAALAGTKDYDIVVEIISGTNNEFTLTI